MDMTQLHRRPPGTPTPSPFPPRFITWLEIDTALHPVVASDGVVELGRSDARQCTPYNNNNSPMIPERWCRSVPVCGESENEELTGR